MLAPVAGRAETPAARLTIRLSSFAFDPERIQLRAGTPVVLHFVNESGGGHDFSAPGFFAASAYPPGASAPAQGRVELRGHETRDVALTPMRPGSYPVECTHFLHGLFGMSGTVEIVP